MLRNSLFSINYLLSAVVGCSIGVVLIGYGIHHYYPSESAIEDIIDMEVTIEDEL